MNADSYLIRSLKSEDQEEVARLLSSSFTKREPITLAMGIQPTEHLPFSRSLVSTAIQDSASFVTVKKLTEEIVGFSISEDFSKAHPKTAPSSPKYIPIVAILDELSRDHHGRFMNRKVEALHLLMIGVSQYLAQNGIAKALSEHSLRWAKKLGYRLAVAEATSLYS